MFAHLEALIAFAEVGTMSAAALRLHISQSAVSKRISNLEHELGTKLVQRAGRNVELTPHAIALLERVRPLLEELQTALRTEAEENSGTLSIAVSTSVLLSWGASVLAKVRELNPQIELRLNSHTTSVALQRVRSGECVVAIVFGRGESMPDLSSLSLAEEPMVIVPSKLKRFAFLKTETVEVMANEQTSDTWTLTEQALKRGTEVWGTKVKPTKRIQTFNGIVQLARNGFGHGLVPRGVTDALGISRSKIIQFPDPGVRLPVSLVGRRSTLARPLVQRFYESLLEHVPIGNRVGKK